MPGPRAPRQPAPDARARGSEEGGEGGGPGGRALAGLGAGWRRDGARGRGASREEKRTPGDRGEGE